MNVGPDAIIQALQDVGAITVEGIGKRVPEDADASVRREAEKCVVHVMLDSFAEARERLRHEEAAATAEAVKRVMAVMEAGASSSSVGEGGKKKKNLLPETRGALEELCRHYGEVQYRVLERDVVRELEDNEYLKVDEKTDQVEYEGDKIVYWRTPQLNKGFGWKSFLLVIVIILMLTPNLMKTLGIY